MTDNLLQLSATDPLSKSQILHLLKTVLSQNYYTFSGSIHIPTTKRFSNRLTFFKHNRWNILSILWKLFIKQLLQSRNIIYYTWYVNDIFIIGLYNKTIIAPDSMTNNMKRIHKDIIFKQTPENNGQINFLHLLLTRKDLPFEIDIYWEPSTTDTTFNFFSNHPIEQNSSIQILHHTCALTGITRVHSLPLSPTREQKEWNTIKYIAKANNFPYTYILKLNLHIQRKMKSSNTQDNVSHESKKWIVFTYYSPQVRKITNLFRQTDVLFHSAILTN